MKIFILLAKVKYFQIIVNIDDTCSKTKQRYEQIDLIKNSNSPLLAKSGAEGVMFVTNNKQSFLFKCLDGSKRGVDLASSYYLKSIGLVNNSPFESQVDLYSMNRQNNKAVEIKISKNF